MRQHSPLNKAKLTWTSNIQKKNSATKQTVGSFNYAGEKEQIRKAVDSEFTHVRTSIKHWPTLHCGEKMQHARANRPKIGIIDAEADEPTANVSQLRANDKACTHQQDCTGGSCRPEIMRAHSRAAARRIGWPTCASVG
jgi:hypothetical protein